jgi:hypothetical protein
MKLNKIQKIDDQIFDLNIKKRMLKNALFEKASKHWLELVNVEYESSSSRTPGYLKCHQVFKRQFSKLLKDNFDIKKIEISKPNHFDLGGFFELTNGEKYNFFIGDLRWDKSFIIRSVTSFKDYTGGNNRQLPLDQGMERFFNSLNQVVNHVSFQEF